MKKLVTGATGFIGSAIARELLKDGEEVKVLIRKTSDTRNIDQLDVEKVYGDIRDGDTMKKALKGCDTLYLTAAYFAHWAPDPKLLYEVNVGGTKASLQAALESGVDKVVYTSTNNAIAASGPVPANEETGFQLLEIRRPLFHVQIYCRKRGQNFCHAGAAGCDRQSHPCHRHE